MHTKNGLEGQQYLLDKWMPKYVDNESWYNKSKIQNLSWTLKGAQQEHAW